MASVEVQILEHIRAGHDCPDCDHELVANGVQHLCAIIALTKNRVRLTYCLPAYRPGIERTIKRLGERWEAERRRSR